MATGTANSIAINVGTELAIKAAPSPVKTTIQATSAVVSSVSTALFGEAAINESRSDVKREANNE